MQSPENVLCVAYVPRELGFQWATGQLSDLELWQHPLTGTGTCLFVAQQDSKGFAETWRQLAYVMRAIPPQEICFKSLVPSVCKRARKFGARVTHLSDDGNHRFWGEGEEMATFLKSLQVFSWVNEKKELAAKSEREWNAEFPDCPQALYRRGMTEAYREVENRLWENSPWFSEWLTLARAIPAQ